MIATVKYQVATYKGEIQVNCDENEEDHIIIARAKRKLIRLTGPLPFGYQHFIISNRSVV
jgi:hypothetical protein